MRDSTASRVAAVQPASDAKASVLTEWNQSARDYPRDKCVHQLFEEQVERTPEAVAVVCEGQSLNYRELNVRARQLGHHLRTLGVRQDEVVAMLLEPSLDVPVAVMGVLMAGGAFVPLVPELPPERIDFMLRDTQARVLLTQTKLLLRLPATEAEVICLDQRESDHPLDGDLGETSPEAAPQGLAYVIYTSGSTGQPKGVLITRGQITLHSLGMIDFYRLHPVDRLLHFAALGFDVAIENLLPPLLVGARVVMRGPDLWAPTTLTRRIRECGITVINLTPSYWRHWLASLDARSVAELLGSLRLVIIGGDVMPMAGVQRWRQLGLENVRLVNMYGPTEATITAFGFEVDASWPKSPAVERVPIGRPLANRCAYILDPQGCPVAIGVTGELYLGGEGIARGYLNRAKLTAERFLPDPFSHQPGARLYRTGDLARYLPDGNVEFLGRLDDQVKIRGYRIELGEIETALGSHPAVAACVVLARNCGGDDKTLAAFVVAREKANLSIESLRSWLSAKLPEYMVPSAYVAVEALPLTGNGKVDRKALEKLGGEELSMGREYVAPRDERECQLAEIWAAVLRRERVGIQDDFFDLGGHSLLAVAICSQIIRRLNVEVPLRWMFEYPSIERLAKQMESLGEHRQDNHPIPKADRHQPLLMSFAQQGMWLGQQTLPDPAMYNESVACRLTGRVDLEKLRRALQVIVERHEVLRTALVLQGEDLLQQVVVAEDVPLAWLEVDLQTVPLDHRQSALEERLLEEARRPFDLAQAPLWRAVWIEFAEEEHVLALTFHHSIVDEWTLRLFFQEWERLYAADGRLEPAGLSELPVQYADYAAWQRRRLTGELLEPQRTYWREQLRDLALALPLPADLTRPIQRSGRGAVHKFQLTGPVVSGLRELARGEGTTLFTAMLAAYQVWLYRYTGQTDVVVSTPMANRERPEAQSLLGCFLNSLPIRVRLEGSPSFREVLRQVRESLLGAFSHADLPFEQMVEMAVKERDPGHQPLYQVMFVLLEEGLPTLHLGQTEARLLAVDTRTSKCDLTLSIEAAGEMWACKFEYATDLFTEETAARMGRHLTELLRSITEDPGKAISELKLMPAAERHQVLVEWNQTERDYPRDKCVHQLFEEQVERTPDAVAVVFEGQSLTYRELNARANQLAHHLRSLAVGPNVLVGLCVERSLEMVVALLGILKAGGAYVPLDPQLPRERLAFLLHDINAPVILLQGRWRDRLSVSPKDSHAGPQFLILEELPALLAASPQSNPPCLNTSEHLAYVMYTSGTTGQPKGVMIPHLGVVRLVINPSYVALSPRDVLLQFAPLAFDASTFEIWGSLLNGARLVVFPARLVDYAELSQVIAACGVTTLWLTAALFHEWVEHAPAALAGVRQLLAGGDVLSPAKVRAYLELPGHGRLINGYGPTENTTFTCCCAFDRAEQVGDSVALGRPIAGTQVFILDAQGRPVPVGVAGEIHAGGDGLARGYLNAPELTAQRFIPNPFSPEPGARLYKTGDLARHLADGQIEFLGRRDQQVKISGYRIELEEIEAVLGEHPDVSACVVLARNHVGGDRTLAAVVVGRTPEAISVGALRSWLGLKLPNYMIPSRFVLLKMLPLTPNGKVDRVALEKSESVDLPPGTEYVAPGTELERQLIAIWQAVLRQDKIGVRDSFFNLGGHSLQAVRLAAEIEKRLGRKLPIAVLFHAPTVEALARRFTAEDSASPLRSLVPIQPLGAKPPLFLIHGWGGNVIGHVRLARLLPSDQPVYGVQAVGLDGKTTRHISVEEMAAHYVQEIRSFQPEGPYYLGGYSMGGLIAFEIAQQLQRLGQRVALLAILDSAPIGAIPLLFRAVRLASYLPSRCLFHLRRWWHMPRHERRDYLRGRWVALRFWLVQNRSQPPVVTAPPKVDSQPPQVAGFDDYYHAVASTYRLRRYPGTADVFFSDEANPIWRRYWRYVVRGGVSFHRVPGGHLEIIRPEHMPLLAKSLLIVLQRVQERERAVQCRSGYTQAKLAS